VTQRYPDGTVRALLETDHVSGATRDALRQRLARPTVTHPAFFDQTEFETLHAVCDRLIPQPDRTIPIDIAGEIDRRLTSSAGNGWRYDELPEDGTMYQLLLRGLNNLALERWTLPFAQVNEASQDEILANVQRGDVEGGVWNEIAAARGFEEVLAEAAEVFYAHPLAQEEIGYVGMADLPAWSAIGLDEREAREPAAVTLP